MLFGVAGLKALTLGAIMLPSTFWPVPKAVESRPELALTLPAKIVAPSTLSKPTKLLKLELYKTFPAMKSASKVVTSIRFELSPKILTKPEEYTLEVSGQSIIIRAHDEQGAFWGVHSLLQLLKSEQVKQTGKGYIIPGIKLHDWPETQFRAFMIQAAWNGTYDDLKTNLDLLARMKIRYFALEFGPRVVLDFDPSIARYGNPKLKFSKKQAKELIDYGRSLGMEPIGYLNTLAHLERAYQKAPYTDHGGIMIQNQESYDKFVFPVLTEMLDVYGPAKYFHCGMDEAGEMFNYFSEQSMDTAGLISAHITKVNDFFAARNIKMVIWHDMLIAPEMKSVFGASIGPANGGSPFNTASALDRIPKSVILDYWNYDPSETFPVIDYLKSKGFVIWSSPWYVPFSIVHDSARKNVPTMGTLWADPPDCFTFSPSDKATALYAQAAWNTSKCPMGGESSNQRQALKTTSDLLYGRKQLGLNTGGKVILIQPGNVPQPTDLSWPALSKMTDQYYGVPFDLSKPAVYSPMQFGGKPIEPGSIPAYVNVPGGDRLALDGVNGSRGEDQLILYMSPMTSTNSNIYGTEVSVSSTGEIISVTDYGSSDTKVPDGGFVLSAHSGPTGEKSGRLLKLKPGDHISVIDDQSKWIGGYQPLELWVRLPNGEKRRIDWTDTPRASGQLVMYESGYANGRTGTNEFGTEVAVKNGEVSDVQKAVGNMKIPLGGYVLSEHSGSSALDKTGLSALKQDDKVDIVTSIGDVEHNLSDMLSRNCWKSTIDLNVERIFMASATKISLVPGTVVGMFRVQYVDGSVKETIMRYGQHAISESGQDVPRSLADDTWLMHPKSGPKACIVYEWVNPKPKVKIESVQFQTNLHSLQSGYVLYGITVVK
jgi:hypothetical protein